MPKISVEEAQSIGKIISRSWTDDAFKQRLLQNANEVFAEYGVEPPNGMQVQAVENTDQKYYLVIPPKPSDDELSMTDLDRVAGGCCCCYSEGVSE